MLLILTLLLAAGSLAKDQRELLKGIELGGSQCWREECGLGDLIADSMLYCGVAMETESKHPGMGGDMDVVGIWDSGSMASKDFTFEGSVTYAMIDEWLGGAKDKNASFVIVKGKDLRRLFETSATALKDRYVSLGQFLHVSQNTRVTYKVADNGVSAGLAEFKVRCSSCESGVWKPLDEEYSYHVVLPSDGYIDLAASAISNGGFIQAHASIGTARECIKAYTDHWGEAGPSQEAIPGGRIVIREDNYLGETPPDSDKYYFEVNTSASVAEVILLSFTVCLLAAILLLGSLILCRAGGKFENPFHHYRFSSTSSTQAFNTNVKV